MTEIKIFSLYGQFILEQRIIAATITINKPGTGLTKYEMVNRTIYIFKAITYLMPIFFERFGIIFNSGKTPLNCYNKFFTSNKPKYETTGEN